jgi:hypothetical protein
MLTRYIAIALLAVLLFTYSPARGATPATSQKDFQLLLQKIGTQSSDPCVDPAPLLQPTEADEGSVFQAAENIVIQALNAPFASPSSSRPQATAALKQLEALSAQTNASWPDENRFHFDVLEVSPLLLIKLTIRASETYYVLAVPPKEDGTPGTEWKQVGEDETFDSHRTPTSRLTLYPLHRGPAGHPRFLAAINSSGCAGSYGTTYEASEWNASESEYLSRIIHQEGASGLEDTPEDTKPSPENPFPSIGKLRTTGAQITLPFCWFSAVDTWDNPSLCAVDTYDLSSDIVRFRSRAYNRPDIVPIAKAIEYSKNHDLPALAAYCTSPAIARRFVREAPSGAEQIQVKRLTNSSERVFLDGGDSYFDVIKRGNRWLVAGFR